MKEVCFHSLGVFLFFLFVCSFPSVTIARDASFLSPSGGGKAVGEAITVEPKGDINLGETAIKIGRRTTVFFVNNSPNPVKLINITASGDDNVRADIVLDDCTKQGTIAAGNRCSVSVETTPLAPGAWTAEVMLTHKGSGRLARAKLIGKTGGSVSKEQKEAGLELSSKNIVPVDFGEVEVGIDRAVRTALMVNDSNEIIKILSIEVIAPENGLLRLDQGCLPEEELKSGASCPVTLVWTPEIKGIVSTDLIIRHSGKRGFAVIPIRGKAILGPQSKAMAYVSSSGKQTSSGSSHGIPLSPTTKELEGMIASGEVSALSEGALSSSVYDKVVNDPLENLHLIGTVGNRAVLYFNGSTFVVELSREFKLGDGKARLMDITAKEAEVSFEDRDKLLLLETVSELTDLANGKKAENKETETSGEDDNSVSSPIGSQ
ncbi:MAG TPA: hypothetical protein DD400_05390 [Rhodospirillaceae bacterium]|nr:hypothetical protein [Rhodospirillaceae bacterium]